MFSCLKPKIDDGSVADLHHQILSPSDFKLITKTVVYPSPFKGFRGACFGSSLALVFAASESEEGFAY